MGVSDMKLTLDQINKIPDVQAREKLKHDRDWETLPFLVVHPVPFLNV